MDVSTVTLIVLIAQAVIYGFMLWRMTEANRAIKISGDAARDSVVLARENAHLDQRAWVAPDGIFTTHGSHQPSTAAVLFKNAGKTFAKQCFVSSQLMVKRLPDADPDFDTLVQKAEQVELGTIAPNSKTKTQRYTLAFNSPDVIMLIFGKVMYKDVFDRDHWTTFCYRIRQSSVGVGFPSIEYEVYGSYNDTDD